HSRRRHPLRRSRSSGPWFPPAFSWRQTTQPASAHPLQDSLADRSFQPTGRLVPKADRCHAGNDGLLTVGLVPHPAGFRAARVFAGDPAGGLILIRVVPPAFGCSMSKAFVFRTRSLSLREPKVLES